MFRDMISRGTDDAIPAHHAKWRNSHAFVAPLLFGKSEIGVCVASVALSDSLGVRTPGCMVRISLGELITDRGRVGNPDLVLLLWQDPKRETTGPPPPSPPPPQGIDWLRTLFVRYITRTLRGRARSANTLIRNVRSGPRAVSETYQMRGDFRRCVSRGPPNHGFRNLWTWRKAGMLSVLPRAPRAPYGRMLPEFGITLILTPFWEGSPSRYARLRIYFGSDCFARVKSARIIARM